MDEILCQFGADILDTSDLIKILSFHQALHVFRLHISSGATCSGRALCRVHTLPHTVISISPRKRHADIHDVQCAVDLENRCVSIKLRWTTI